MDIWVVTVTLNTADDLSPEEWNSLGESLKMASEMCWIVS